MSDNTWSVSQLREALRRGDIHALEQAGLVGETELNVLLKLDQYHPEGLESDKAQRILKRSVSHTVRDVVESGNQDAAAFAVGMVGNNQRIDARDWNKYEMLKDLYRNPPQVSDNPNEIFQMAIFSNAIPPTGRGKTSFGYFMVEIAQSVNDNLRVLSNNPNDPFDTTDKKWSNIEKEIKSYDGEMLLYIDEAAQFLQFSDQSGGMSISKIMKLLRHNDTHLIMVGHTGMDIPKDIRRQMYFANKTSKTEAVIGYGIKDMKNDDRKEINNVECRVTVPDTEIDYGGKGDPARDIIFDDGENSSDDDDESVNICQAETNSGSQCNNQAKYPSDNPVVCHNHLGRLGDLE